MCEGELSIPCGEGRGGGRREKIRKRENPLLLYGRGEGERESVAAVGLVRRFRRKGKKKRGNVPAIA